MSRNVWYCLTLFLAAFSTAIGQAAPEVVGLQAALQRLPGEWKFVEAFPNAEIGEDTAAKARELWIKRQLAFTFAVGGNGTPDQPAGTGTRRYLNPDVMDERPFTFSLLADPDGKLVIRALLRKPLRTETYLMNFKDNLLHITAVKMKDGNWTELQSTLGFAKQ